MAEPVVTKGTVGSLKISKAFELGVFWLIEEDSGIPAFFILWDSDYSPIDYINHSAWVSMLRDALKHGMEVRVAHDDDSSVVTELEIVRPQT